MTRRQTNQRRRRNVGLVIVGGVFGLCVAVAFLGLVVALALRDAGPPGTAVATPAESHSATLTLAYSPEKATLLRDLTDKFNARNVRTPDRQLMRVELVELKPDVMVEQALAETAQFQALTPDSSLWLDQLNSRYAQAQQVPPGAIRPRLTGDAVRYAVTPIVIAAWEESARSLGWPAPVRWTTLQTRAQQDPNFKWNHPSTAHASGLLATLAEFYAGAGVQRGLTVELAQDPKTIEFVSAIEKTVRYYGEGELAVIQRAVQEGPKFLDAFVTPEQLVVAFNTGAFGRPPARLIAIYPAEGTLWADHPLALLETPALTANQRRTFQAFREFLLSAEAQAAVLAAGYRPADLSVSLAGPNSPLTPINGVDPAQPQTTLQLPSPEVVSVVQNAWALAKRRANIFLVVDTSGSMHGQKMQNMREALRTFVAQIPSDQEKIGLVEFNSGVTNVIELDTLARNRAALTRAIDGMEAAGNTAFLDAVRTAYRRLQRDGDPSRINAIVAMTDGRENASRVSLQQLLDEVRRGNQTTPVLIFCVAYGSDADYRLLETLANVSGGQVRAGTLETIRELYKILSSYF